MAELDLIKVKSLILNPNIKIIGIRGHSKASEVYVDVLFNYPKSKSNWNGSIPIEYRRTGTFVKNEQELVLLIIESYDLLLPEKAKIWQKEQQEFWKQSGKQVTKPFFDVLNSSYTWKCQNHELPSNPNWARRFQDIKEFGYTTATNTKMPCKKCNRNTTHVMLLPFPKSIETGYETWSKKLRDRIIKSLDNYDVYDDVKRNSLLPDHKFPEIRWDANTKQENPDNMSDKEIKRKFQLLSNQRNQQKREVCRKCFQTGERGKPFGINFFYEGNEQWPSEIPKNGAAAEKGCIGCGWYDLELWRKKLNETTNSH